MSWLESYNKKRTEAELRKAYDRPIFDPEQGCTLRKDEVVGLLDEVEQLRKIRQDLITENEDLKLALDNARRFT